MKVEFTIDETHRMFEAVIDEVVALKTLDTPDRAMIRRWRAEEMVPGSPLMKRLSDRINEEIQHSHDRSEVSAIKKPDWV